MSSGKTIHAAQYADLVGFLRSERKRLGLSQQEVSQAVGMAQSDISKIENQERRLDVFEFQKLLQIYRLGENRKLENLVTEFLGLNVGLTMQVAERNETAKYYVDAKISYAKKQTEDSFLSLDQHKYATQLLRDLIYVSTNGFRGVVLTAIVGMKLDQHYDPLNNFYACNPRSIFEQGIWYALTENKIPCGKSDPLNVAKNINELNESWVAGKRPQKAAQAAVDFLRLVVNESNTDKKEQLVDFFFFNLVQYAKTIEDTTVSQVEGTAKSNQAIAHKLVEFVLGFPEAGTVPQFVVGKLLTLVLQYSSVTVKGADESVFGTNATSKKPSDIWVSKQGEPVILYEITVKKIDYKRLDDCLDALNRQDMLDKSVTFICRLPIDVSSLDVSEESNVRYKGKHFDFLDIGNFIKAGLALLSQSQMSDLLRDMMQFVQEVNRPLKTKKGWNSIFSEDAK